MLVECREIQGNAKGMYGSGCKLPGECRGMPGERMGVGAKCQGNQVNVKEWVQSAWEMQVNAGECQGNGGEWR